MEIYVATTETRNFSFTGYGSTKKQALEAIQKVFKSHMNSSGGWITWDEVKDDVFVTTVELGKGYVA